jgi:hypothetical protein
MEVYRFEPRLNSVSARQSAPGSARSTIAMTATADNPSETEIVFFDLERSRLEELQATAAGCGIRASLRGFGAGKKEFWSC